MFVPVGLQNLNDRTRTRPEFFLLWHEVCRVSKALIRKVRIPQISITRNNSRSKLTQRVRIMMQKNATVLK